MKERYFPGDLRRFRRCPHGRLMAALRKHFGPSLRYYRWVDDRYHQSHAVDLIVYFQNGSQLRIELKQPQKTPANIESADFALETWSSQEAQARGMLLKGGMKTDYVLWVYRNGASAMLPFKTLAASFRHQESRWKARFPVHECANRGLFGGRYTSECIFVPFQEIRRAMRRHLRKFGINYEPRIAA